VLSGQPATSRDTGEHVGDYDLAVAAVAAGGAVIAFGVVAYLLDRGDLRAVVARLRRTGGTGR